MTDSLDLQFLKKRIAILESEIGIRTQHLELATDGYFDWDLQDLGYEYLSPKFWERLGYDPNTKVHSPNSWAKVIHPEDKRRSLEAFEKHIECGDPYDLEVRYKHAKGHWEYVTCRGQVIRNEKGEPVRFIGTHHFITELKRAQAALEQFAFHAAHDMQEPLRKISAFGERLQKFEKSLPEKGKLYLDRMLDATNRMSTLIEDLLKYARVQRGAQEFEEVDLREVIEDILDLYEDRLATCGAEVTVDASLGKVKGDRTQLRQLFQNLISNAIKFRKKGVPLRIIIQSRHLDLNTLEISVQDNGIGFEEKYKEKIFQVFQRLHGRSEYTGTGIGLAVCARIAESHGGSLDVRSNPGEGSVFLVSLPL